MIGVLDYGLGNLRSVVRGFDRAGARAEPCNDPAKLSGYDRAVLPGVGAFGDGMARLHQGGWAEVLRQFAQSGRPLLGVCLGMQLLLDRSTETAGDTPEPGLGLIPGGVQAFDHPCGPQGQRLKVPHMGWNTLNPTGDTAHPLLQGIRPDDHVYFVHGYHARCEDDASVLATCDYGGPFAAVIGRGNLVATQFHPEKSQRVGLAMLDRFARWSP
ncbi:MAG: imidazole glycerol phosphate synthase subunit HisH [Planctomycetota bacterium]